MQHLLRDRGFSRLAGYWRHFEADPVTHRFAADVSVTDIANVYEFDARLRRILAAGLGVFEVALRSRLGYEIAIAGDAAIYLEPAAYVTDAHVHPAPEVPRRQRLVTHLHQELQRSKEQFVLQHTRVGRTPPVWLALEVLSLGSVSKMYRLWADSQVRRQVARSFGYPNPRFAESVFHSLTILRNVCAHHARLWHRTNIQIAPRVLRRLRIDDDQSIYRSTPWAWIVVLGDLVDTIQADTAFSTRLRDHLSAHPQYLAGLQHPTA
jgi:abortive infection bacteriophage resistance protein